MTQEVEIAKAREVAPEPSQMRCSAQINEICAALAKAQGIINNPGKKATNPHFKSQYADLSMGLNAIREGLSTNGLAIIQSTRMQRETLMLDTRLAHSSGQWFEAEYPVCKLPAAPQAVGSALTYARRYSLFGLVGIAGEDDDGNSAGNGSGEASFVTDHQAGLLLDEIEKQGGRTFDAIVKAYWPNGLPESLDNLSRLDVIKKLPADQFADCVQRLNDRRAAAKAKSGEAK